MLKTMFFRATILLVNLGFALSENSDRISRVFWQAGINEYSVPLVTDEQDGNRFLYVGRKDYFLRLKLTDLTLLDKVQWFLNETEHRLCETPVIGYQARFCHNYVFFIHVAPDRVLICGTQETTTGCTYRNPAALTHVISSEADTRVCPVGWTYQATWLVTDDGALYTACYNEATSAAPVLRRMASPLLLPLTSPSVSRPWFNFPTFVTSYEWGDYVYFAFREKSDLGDMRTISSLARVCKNDVGMGQPDDKVFSTFAKSRLSCSIPVAGDQDFHFHHLQATYFSPGDQTLYAVFNAPPLQGTVVCLYNMDGIMAAFDGTYRSVYSTKTHKKVSCRQNMKSCGGASVTSDADEIDDDSVNCVKTQQDLLPVNKQPLFFCDKERWTHIIVDRYETSLGNLSVVYVATETGKIKKLVANVTTPNFYLTCQIDSVQVTWGTTPILNMKFSKSEAAMYVALEDKIVKVPFRNCSRYENVGDCFAAMDPYCGWDVTTSRCTTKEASLVFWYQIFAGCPQKTDDVTCL